MDYGVAIHVQQVKKTKIRIQVVTSDGNDKNNNNKVLLPYFYNTELNYYRYFSKLQPWTGSNYTAQNDVKRFPKALEDVVFGIIFYRSGDDPRYEMLQCVHRRLINDLFRVTTEQNRSGERGSQATGHRPGHVTSRWLHTSHESVSNEM